MEARLGPALGELCDAGSCAAFAFLHLPGSLAPWTDTGLDVSEGDALTILAEGTIVTSEALRLRAGARFHLWRRIVPGGQVLKGTQDTTSFRAERAGRVELGILHGEWATPAGELATLAEAWPNASGALDVAVVRWAPGVAPERGLAALRARLGADRRVDAELARLRHPVLRPPGWEYLWRLGESDTFSCRTEQGRGAIACHTRDDAAILRRALDLPTSEDATLSWRWRIDALPSGEPEDALLQHDYLSVAVEWESGQDVTWLWSSRLEPGRVFRCPIPQWAPRETHVVVRSGAAGLGAWQSESRRLHEEHVRVLGAAPGRIVGVWLIAVSLFQHGEGRAEFDSLVLRSDGREVELC